MNSNTHTPASGVARAGHTPGPWNCYFDEGWNLRHEVTDERIPFSTANARLIAATPDLLAALKRAEYLVTGQEYLDALAVIRAALAKAGN
jgi:hypothetical protein